MLSHNHLEDLDKKGYTVVNDVITSAECDNAIGQYKEWLAQFEDGFPRKCNKSIISKYNVGHLGTTWELRLKTKKVFSQLWKTEKLLTSIDAIAIGRPPEDGQESFQIPGNHWLHTDQPATRVGLHAYQGALYLEEQCADDWTFQVLEGSHAILDEFYTSNQQAAKFSESVGYCALSPEEKKFFDDGGCRLVRIPASKGSIVLWDSRLIHDNARPLENRQHPGRWRYIVFVSMTPAIWSSERDMVTRKRVYEKAMMTNHWSSQKLRPILSKGPSDVAYPKCVPEVAKTEEGRQLCGLLPYNFDDGAPNGGNYRPKWKPPLLRFPDWDDSDFDDLEASDSD